MEGSMGASAAELAKLLAGLVGGGSDSCLKGTPMIPLHINTVRAILGRLDVHIDKHGAPAAICGYPLPGWRLQRIEYHDGRELNSAPGWIVSLHSETDNPFEDRRRYRCIMTRSLVGPLEAWDEAMQIAVRENTVAAERVASAIEARRAETVQLGSVHESAVPQADAPETPHE